jgi:hypothetical protein
MRFHHADELDLLVAGLGSVGEGAGFDGMGGFDIKISPNRSKAQAE